jgi:hypothetical protein
LAFWGYGAEKYSEWNRACIPEYSGAEKR